MLSWRVVFEGLFKFFCLGEVPQIIGCDLFLVLFDPVSPNFKHIFVLSKTIIQDSSLFHHLFGDKAFCDCSAQSFFLQLSCAFLLDYCIQAVACILLAGLFCKFYGPLPDKDRSRLLHCLLLNPVLSLKSHRIAPIITLLEFMKHNEIFQLNFLVLAPRPVEDGGLTAGPLLSFEIGGQFESVNQSDATGECRVLDFGSREGSAPL